MTPIALALGLLLSCAAERPDEKLYLSSGWTWSAEGANGEASGWKPLDDSALSSLESLLPSGTGFVQLRREFSLPESLKGRDLACFLGRVTMADRTYLNDFYVGGEGRLPPDYFSAWNKVRVYRLPERALFRDGVNVLRARVWVDHEGSIAGLPFISGEETVERAATRDVFWNQTINLLSAAVMLIMGGYHFMLYVRRKKERENLTFALINLFSSIYLTNFFLSEIPGLPWPGMSFLWFQKIVANGMLFILVYLFTSFVRQFLGHRGKGLVLAFRLVLLLVPLAMIMLAPGYGELRAMRLWTQLFLLPPLGYILFMAVASLRDQNKEAVALLWGLSPLVLAALVDTLLHEGLKLYEMPYISGLGWQLVIISLLFILAGRFARSRTAVEDLNENLERKVKDRTLELTRANDELSRVNDKLEAARVQAERDMKMAAYVQESFYPREAAKSEGWDMAFRFVPMSGVSGDLYDFYGEGKSLRGLGLFDVSGHGIASGLVAMLAKSIVHRQFVEGQDQSLGAVMDSINKKLIAEKGEIENYLSGILLRLDGPRVEYVNAGHPDMLFRQARTGQVRAVVSPTKDAKGLFLGIEGLGSDYRALRFAMEAGDALLLYSDCLCESKNAAGEEFGIDRLRAALGAAYWSSAAAIQDTVLDHFEDFVGDAPLKDDLTVITLLRTK